MDNNFATTSQKQVGALTNVGTFFAQVYGWMTLGLMITAGVAFAFYNFAPLRIFMNQNLEIFIFAFIFQLIIVIALSFAVRKMHPLLAVGLFLFYSALMGMTLTGVFYAYTAGSIFTTFLAATGTFLFMSFLGFITKSDLSRWGSLAIMGIFGLIFGSIVNLFLRSTGVDLLLTYGGIFIFLILIAYDTQKIKKFAALAEQTGSSLSYSILAALELYLDFINLFIRMLRLFGKRR